MGIHIDQILILPQVEDFVLFQIYIEKPRDAFIQPTVNHILFSDFIKPLFCRSIPCTWYNDR
jgi:hypothetical protein